jgi:hypothetical protein
MIVHTRKPKPRTTVQAHTPPPIAPIATTKKPGPRRREPEPIDPEVEAKAWFAKNIRPPSE